MKRHHKSIHEKMGIQTTNESDSNVVDNDSISEDEVIAVPHTLKECESLLLVYGAGCSILPQVNFETDIYGMSYDEMHLNPFLATLTKG
jgi:hypothetical protein